MEAQAQRNARAVASGVVLGSKMHKTLKVSVERVYRHPKYGKFVRQRKVYYAHDETGQAKAGDRVEIAACRPMSKLKRWRLVSVVQAADPNAMLHAGAAELETGMNG